MIDLHTHSLLSDGELLPSELVRRAGVKGYHVIAITDHVDSSNIDFVVPRIVKVVKELNKYWADMIKVIPGAEITHVPLEQIKQLIQYCRSQGKVLVIVHGESPVEPVIKGTNKIAIEAQADILAHPGWISAEEAMLAKEKGVYLELTTRKGHCNANKHVLNIALKVGAELILNSDAHAIDDIWQEGQDRTVLEELGIRDKEILQILNNSSKLAERFIT